MPDPSSLNIEHCEFPDDLYYDVDNDVWFREPSGNLTKGRMGITSTLVFLAGKIDHVKVKTNLSSVERGTGLGTIESPSYFGAIRSPVSGTLSRFNTKIVENPAMLDEDPYGAGWYAEYESFDRVSFGRLFYGASANSSLQERIRELKVKCYKALPDEQMYAIGVECSATLASLDELLSKKPQGFVVRLVTDDPVADIEMVRWSMQTKNELVESRREDGLFHFIVRKTAT